VIADGTVRNILNVLQKDYSLFHEEKTLERDVVVEPITNFQKDYFNQVGDSESVDSAERPQSIENYEEMDDLIKDNETHSPLLNEETEIVGSAEAVQMAASSTGSTLPQDNSFPLHYLSNFLDHIAVLQR
jgi:hypothetical protein